MIYKCQRCHKHFTGITSAMNHDCYLLIKTGSRTFLKYRFFKKHKPQARTFIRCF